MTGAVQDDTWFQAWEPVITEVIQAWDFDRRYWRYFPYAGGLYDQAEINPATWEIWTIIITIYNERVTARQRKQAEKGNLETE